MDYVPYYEAQSEDDVKYLREYGVPKRTITDVRQITPDFLRNKVVEQTQDALGNYVQKRLYQNLP